MIDEIGMISFVQRMTDAIRPCVLPDDCVVDRLACAFIPDQCCLPLIGNANGGNIGGVDLRLGQCGTNNFARTLPYFARIMFDPTTLRKDLLVFSLSIGKHSSTVVKEHKACASCAGIDSTNVLCHGSSTFSLVG